MFIIEISRSEDQLCRVVQDACDLSTLNRQENTEEGLEIQSVAPQQQRILSRIPQGESHNCFPVEPTVEYMHLYWFIPWC